MPDRPVLVTGAMGLIGHAVRVALEAAGRPVLAVDREAGSVAGRPVVAGDVTAVHRLHALARDTGGFAGILHCGAYSGPMVARDDPSAIVAVNIAGTANILELARIHTVPRVVVCSSVSAYGHTPQGLSPVPEATPLHPTTVYGASKAAAEALVDGYGAQYGLDGLSLRIGWVYGPRRSTACTLRDMLRHALAGRPFTLPCGADSHRQYAYVDDMARALVLAPRRPEPSAAGLQHQRRHLRDAWRDRRPRQPPRARCGHPRRPRRRPAGRPSGPLRPVGRRPRPRLHAGHQPRGRHPSLCRLARQDLRALRQPGSAAPPPARRRARGRPWRRAAARRRRCGGAGGSRPRARAAGPRPRPAPRARP
jgi:UDP-glucuronate 4-epimerase